MAHHVILPGVQPPADKSRKHATPPRGALAGPVISIVAGPGSGPTCIHFCSRTRYASFHTQGQARSTADHKALVEGVEGALAVCCDDMMPDTVQLQVGT